MVIYNHAIVDIYNTHQVKEPVFPSNITILNVNFPELIGSCYFLVPCNPAWMLKMYPPLRLQYI
ncbi:hypothetical protein A6M21_16445 [Desulfotomaculum copahuensis]|uniref:Uncharacterized protein n=1 Tax=Desulfotomaculum copahuensis TaxID=1838280 RepID=A0A1B7LAD9_9FIRM|nr:hypothetical protein A6M21_16445 [Desulfotomaculum copahuensis]